MRVNLFDNKEPLEEEQIRKRVWVDKFAWVPIIIKHELLWLERYQVRYVWKGLIVGFTPEYRITDERSS